jgi:hypothetical protein
VPLLVYCARDACRANEVCERVKRSKAFGLTAGPSPMIVRRGTALVGERLFLYNPSTSNGSGKPIHQ